MQRPMQRTRHGSMGSGIIGFVVACLLPLISVPAAASIEYPILVKSQWNAKKIPVPAADGCPLCHTTDPGRLGTATQKFALTLRGFGLTSKNDGALKSALDKAKASATDSDGDGFSDYQEIAVDSTNPNDAKEHAEPTTEPMPTTGSGGSGAGPQPVGDAGAIDQPDDNLSEGGGGSADEVPPDEALPICTTTVKKIYPELTHGCSIGNGSADFNTMLLASAFTACLIRRAARTRKSRRESRDDPT